MAFVNDIRHGRYCVFQMNIHLVFGAKYRTKVCDAAAIHSLRLILAKVGADFEAQLGEMEGEADQVHRLIHYGPQHSVSAMVNSLKGVSRRLLRSARPDLAHQYWKGVLLVTFLLGCNLGRSANQHPQAVHRISKDTDLTESLYIPTLKGEVLRSIG